LRRPDARAALQAGMAALEPKLPLRVPLLIGEQHTEGDALVSTDPGASDRVVALAPRATPADASRALEVAGEAAPRWAATPAIDRAQSLVRAAAWMRERRHELAALCVRECAKPWGEADADVAEAIDFLEYYARGAISLDGGATLIQVPGERNTMRYAPRGVCAVIAPWNFPLAIPTGMTAAALATGNAAILKPAEQAPGCGAMVVEALRAGGVPAGAIALLPGEGDVGAALVADPRVHTIAFTGSAPVGLEILGAAAEVHEGQRHIKRVVAEMGGKNCVIVDADADLDDAVPAIVRSAFVYAGQKCSAAARVLVHEAIADALTERVAGAVDTLQVGQADAFGTDVPPVIEREAQGRVERYAEIGAREGTIAARRADGLPEGGWFCAPTVVTGLPADSPVLGDEIFGPVLAIERVRDVDDALDLVDGLRFALTGGLFCRNPRTVERVAARTPVGNLYVNRHITGAMVGRQPFGGNRLSGTGTKAGGPDYLLQFVEPRVVTENTVRHGLVV
ncbi:MAG: RHH-type transcriptional regulator, proline utilization regulon repressor / proline dehydrogenase, partial [Solirubrobacteraceae bacterium]|nr:RHH-type transcriptional regulator, proline utilization regulon repressor / proline dehydrogenase [Solirubrobacteraceae bacterium]